MSKKFLITISIILASCITFTAQASPNDISKHSQNKAKKVVVVKQPKQIKTNTVQQLQHKKVAKRKTVVIKQKPNYKTIIKKPVVVVKQKAEIYSIKTKNKVKNRKVIII